MPNTNNPKLDDVLSFALDGHVISTNGRLRPHGSQKDPGGPSKRFSLSIKLDRMTVAECLGIVAEAAKVKWQNKVRGDFSSLDDGVEHSVTLRELGLKAAPVTKEAAIATLRAKVKAGELTAEEAMDMILGN